MALRVPTTDGAAAIGTELHSQWLQCQEQIREGFVNLHDRIYFAAYVDGEGSIGLYRNKGSRDSRYRSGFKNASWIRSVTIGSTCHSVLDDVLQATGLGRIMRQRKHGAYKPMFYWSVGSKTAIIEFLEDIIPFMREKKGQAITLVAECKGEIDTVAAAHFLKEAKL